MNKLLNQITQSGPRPSYASESVRHVFVRDLVLDAVIGVYEHERAEPQRIRVNVDLAVTDCPDAIGDRLEQVVSYEDVINHVRAAIDEGHVNLVETLAEKIARRCLLDARVRVVRIRIEKLDVFPEAGGVGIEIERASQ